jgi:hypothetical protein
MNLVLVRAVGHAQVMLLVVRVTLIGTNYTRLKMATEEQLKKAINFRIGVAISDLMSQFAYIQARYGLTEKEMLEILAEQSGADFASQYDKYIDLLRMK